VVFFQQIYKNGVYSLFKTVKENLPYKLHEADQIIKAINELKKNKI
jgi:hypothetical protein